MHQKKKIPPERQNTSAHIMRKIYTNCHSAGNYLKVSTAVLNQALPFCACNYFRAFFFSTMHQKKRFLLKDKNTSAHILRIIYTNCHSAGNYLKVSAAVINQALPFCACNYFRALFFSTMHQKKRFLLKDKNTGEHILRIIYTNCHSAGNYLKLSAAVINQALPFYACNHFRALFFSTTLQKKRFLLKDKNTGEQILRMIYTNCHSAGNYLKVSAALINQALPFYACNYFRALFLVQRIKKKDSS